MISNIFSKNNRIKTVHDIKHKKACLLKIFISIVFVISLSVITHELITFDKFERPSYLVAAFLCPFIFALIILKKYDTAFIISAVGYAIIITIGIIAGSRQGTQLISIPGLILFIIFFTSKRVSQLLIIYSVFLTVLYFIINRGSNDISIRFIIDNFTSMLAICILATFIVKTFERSLIERDILIQEIHHRVKNNLQIISSLLFLQSNNKTGQNQRTGFIEFQQRVLSIAKVHEQLYNSKNFGLICIDEVIREIETNLLCTFPHGDIRFVHNTNNHVFNLQTAVPLALIINELITNSLKHNENKKNLTVEIKIIQLSQKTYELTIQDNGQGFDDLIHLGQMKTLGLLLVNMLIIQLNGDIIYGNDDGASVILSFCEIDGKIIHTWH